MFAPNIETSELIESEKFLETGGFDTTCDKHAGLLNHRNMEVI
jgi:hypothetical protein